MKISEILKKDFIIPDLTAPDKPSAISELCHFLEKKGVIRDQKTLINALMEREKLGSTGIGESMAIPHAKSDEIDQIVIVFARAINGIDFESLDQKPVHFICLLLAPTHSTGLHLKALARIARLFKSVSLRGKILEAHGSDSIYSTLVEEDSKIL